MAYEIPTSYLTLNAPSTAFSAKQYYAVVASSSEGIFAAATTAANVSIIGILQSAPSVTGEPCQIVTAGVTKIKASEALTVGARFAVGSSGTAASTNDIAARTGIWGTVLETAASSEIVTVNFGFIGLASSS